MTQSDTLKILRKSKTWMKVQEIADNLKISTGSVNNNLQRLFKTNAILMKELNQQGRPRVWMAKI